MRCTLAVDDDGRDTIAFSAVAARYLMHRRAGTPDSLSDTAIPILDQLVRANRFWFWGESAFPHFLCIAWMLEHTGKCLYGEHVLIQILTTLTRSNHQLSENPVAGPDISGDEVLTSLFQKFERTEPRRGRKAPVSYCLESIIHLLALRMRRQALKGRWYEITHVEMASFQPKHIADALLWHCDHGEEKTRLQGKPQSWQDLTGEARANDLSSLPSILNKDADFALEQFNKRCSRLWGSLIVFGHANDLDGFAGTDTGCV